MTMNFYFGYNIDEDKHEQINDVSSDDLSINPI